MATDLKCPNCGASASLPLGMTCADHRPMPYIDEYCCDGADGESCFGLCEYICNNHKKSEACGLCIDKFVTFKPGVECMVKTKKGRCGKPIYLDAIVCLDHYQNYSDSVIEEMDRNYWRHIDD